MSRLTLIIGSNGSGKSTVMKSIIGEGFDIKKNAMGCYTISQDGRRVCVGKYLTPCGGCDGIKATPAVHNMVDWLCRKFPESDIYFEGVLISGIFENTAKLLLECIYSLNRETSVHYLWTSPALSVRRVNDRNGGKKLKTYDNIIDKTVAVKSTFLKHRELNLYPCIAYDTSRLSADEIASRILNFKNEQ